jgi:serine/threonine-protein phosphatase 2B catalytic subunit
MEPLSDPLNDRVISSVPRPPHRPLPIDTMIKPYSRIPNWLMVKDHLASGGTLSRSSAIYLITQARYIFERERTILETTDDITIIGDIHGQFFDLLHIFENSLSITKRKMLFLGDYVDRGRYSIEVILLLFALKQSYPNSVLMIRGNHETRDMTSHYSFRKEVLNKYGLDLYELLMETFDAMPLACIINNEYFAVHGGISPSIKGLEDIIYINRFQEPREKGLVCDLLWSDPAPENVSIRNFSENTSRGCGFYFGKSAARTFLKNNRFKGIIRAHEVQSNGYKILSLGESLSVVTVFSAANYCGVKGNKGAFLTVLDSNIEFRTFDVNPSPFELPNSDDLFTWSVPFVVDKVLAFFKKILKQGNEDSTFEGYVNEQVLMEMVAPCLEPGFDQGAVKRAVFFHECSDGDLKNYGGGSRTERNTRKTHKFEFFDEKLKNDKEQYMPLVPRSVTKTRKFVSGISKKDLEKVSIRIENFLNVMKDFVELETFPCDGSVAK